MGIATPARESAQFMSKLDDRLAELYDRTGFQEGEALVLMVRYREGADDPAISLVQRLGGKIRHKFKPISRLGIALAPDAIIQLIQVDYIEELSMDSGGELAGGRR